MNKKSIIKLSDKKSEGMSKNKAYAFLVDNNYIKIGHGIYSLPDVFVDELAVLQKRCPNGVISHDEALYYYNLVDREPSKHTITVYSGYNTSRLKKAGYKTYYVKKELLDLGKTKVIDYCDNEVYMYDLDRTMIDLFRNRNEFEIQDFNTALKSYVKNKNKNLSNLYLYAKKFRLERIVKSYMEILL